MSSRRLLSNTVRNYKCTYLVLSVGETSAEFPRGITQTGEIVGKNRMRRVFAFNSTRKAIVSHRGLAGRAPFIISGGRGWFRGGLAISWEFVSVLSSAGACKLTDAKAKVEPTEAPWCGYRAEGSSGSLPPGRRLNWQILKFFRCGRSVYNGS